MRLHLTDDEIQEITGKTRWSAQVRALRQLGLDVKPRLDGKPLVVRQHYLQQMGVSYTDKVTVEQEPDWGVLDHAS